MAFRPITINIGPNNSGKSSILKSIDLIKNSLLDINASQGGAFSNHILEEIHSYLVPNLGEPKSFLNSPEKEISFSLSVPDAALTKDFRKHEVSLSLYYKFSKRIKAYSYSNTDSFNKKEGSEISESQYLNELVFGSIEELKGKGVLTKYLICIDQKPVVELSRSEEYYDAGAYEGGSFTEAYSGELSFLNPEVLFLLSKIESIEIPSKINLEYLGDCFIDSTKLPKYVTEELQKRLVPFSKEVGALLNSCQAQAIRFQNYISDIQFVNLDRRENKRYIDKESSGLFKTCIDHYFNKSSTSTSKIHETLTRILPLFGLPKIFRIDFNNDFGFQFKLEVAKGVYRNIADFGSGINQLLPLLLATSINIRTSHSSRNKSQADTKDFYNQPLLLVEEPESNLHPALQSKLADMFSILHKGRNLDFIIETHSEYMVRRFQNLIALGELNSTDVVINYFWKDKGVHKCKQIEFKEDGGLTDTFENGFFDESLMLELDLLKIKNIN